MIILSQVGRHPPEMERDKWWDDSVPKELPYTISALPFRHETDMALTDKEEEAPVFLVPPPAHGQQDSARKLSSHSHHSHHSFHSVSASIFSSIKGAMFGRKHSTADSVWSTEAGSNDHHTHQYLNPVAVAEAGSGNGATFRKISTCSAVPNFIPKLDVIEEATAEEHKVT